MPIEWLNVMQASARVGVSRRTIYNWLKAGKLAYARTPGGSIRIDASTLLKPDLKAPESAKG